VEISVVLRMLLPKYVRVGVLAMLIVTDGCGSTAGKAAVATKHPPTVLELTNGGDEQAQRDRLRTMQMSIATCMKKDGWKYSPIDADKAFIDPRLGDLAKFRAQYGYGVSIEVRPTTIPVDPNIAYMESLSAVEVPEYNRSQNGCNEAAAKAAGPLPMQNQVISDAFDRFDADLLRDPRIQEAQLKWSDCMTQVGYSYKNVAAIVSDLESRMQELYATAGVGIASVPASTGTPTGPYVDSVELNALQQLELAIAKADNACNDKYLAKVAHDIGVKQAAELVKQFPELARK
jgi:hypothetical protein